MWMVTRLLLRRIQLITTNPFFHFYRKDLSSQCACHSRHALTSTHMWNCSHQNAQFFIDGSKVHGEPIRSQLSADITCLPKTLCIYTAIHMTCICAWEDQGDEEKISQQEENTKIDVMKRSSNMCCYEFCDGEKTLRIDRIRKVGIN